MSDPADRSRRFEKSDKVEREYGEQSVRRRLKTEEDPGDFPTAYDGSEPRRLTRRSLRERDEEESRRVLKSRRRDDDIDDDDRPRTPAMVRLFAWVALLAVFFATGYIGANYLFKSFTDGKGPPAASGVVNSGMAVSQKTEPLGNASYKLFIPANGKFSERAIEIQRGLPEEDIQQLLTVYIDGLKETGVLETGVSVLNIFRSGDWLYADMSADFLKSLKKIGRNKSAEIIGGLVKTMQENFPPIKKVKFYIDGKESTDKNPVDLANPWELKG